MVKKVKVKEKVYTYSGYELEGKVVDVITMLQSLVTKLGPDVLIDYEQSQHYDDYEFNVYIEREETSVERLKRLDKQKADKTQRDVCDRREYEKLKLKFGE